IAIGAMRDSYQTVRRAGTTMLVLLLIQFSLGIANIVMFVPISVAVMHNAVASLLLASAGVLLFHTKYSRN
ncbi:MAG: COX15/CtaA family protein, partial [Gammaproteobacteria bacterium]